VNTKLRNPRFFNRAALASELNAEIPVGSGKRNLDLARLGQAESLLRDASKRDEQLTPESGIILALLPDWKSGKTPPSPTDLP